MEHSLSEKTLKHNKSDALAARLLAWYDLHRRVLPWRALAGGQADPYHVWLSEIMLQQTTVAAVGPYFKKFLDKWPTVQSLAAADLDDVMRMWAGLGYYRRARGLHACAQNIVKDYDGFFPSEEKELLKLPGVGPYTAAAVRAIAFDQKANVIDGNVERVVARLFAIETPMPKAKRELRDRAESLLPSARFGDYAQVLMDLGATVCTPRNPKCDVCPWPKACAACAQGDSESYPRREAPKAKPTRRGLAFVVFDRQGRALIRKRETEGLLAGMMEVPSTPWGEGKRPSLMRAEGFAPLKADWKVLKGTVYHSFTHFDLELGIAVARIATKGKIKGQWVAPENWATEALPRIMHKVLGFAQGSMKGK